jgi:hypothetical protein
MKKIVRQVLGIDVAQKELVVCLGRMFDMDWALELYSHRTFNSSQSLRFRDSAQIRTVMQSKKDKR